MPSTTAFTTAAKLAYLRGEILAAHTYRMPLYTSVANNGAATAAYTTTGEVTGTGYTATGNALTSFASSSSGTTAWIDFADTTWSSASFTAASSLLYSDTNPSDVAIGVFDFGGNQTVASGTFTLQFPTPDATNAIVRLQ